MTDRNLDAVIVGAGFGGLYMLHRLRTMGLKTRVFEAGSGVGGTWFWNRYPGARCDLESMQYSFQFSDELQQEWEWTERYAAQPEILSYLNHVADRFELRDDIQLDTRVLSAVFDEAAGGWTVTTSDGVCTKATFCIMATGCLSSPMVPKIDGLELFAGRRFHTAYWPHEPVDFNGENVAVIGTGSSAIQSIPKIAEQARHLFVFQRTPTYSVPAHNKPMDQETQRAIKKDYAELRAQARLTPTGVAFEWSDASALEATPEELQREYEARWQRGGLQFLGAYSDLLYNENANVTAAKFVRAKIRSVVRDPKIAAALSPQSILGCKRLCVDTNYYETFNRPNVTLIDVSDRPIEAVTRHGIKANGKEFPVDSIVFATGFDAMTGTLLKIDIRGRGGRKLGEQWKEGPRAYLGISVAGFPNLFLITGPGSPSVLTNMIMSIEQHVEWIDACVRYMRDLGLKLIEAKEKAQENWVAHVSEAAGKSLRSTCSSWYLGANVPGKPRVFMPYIGGLPAYREKCEEVVANGYEGFVTS